MPEKGLTSREQEILGLIRGGMSNKDISVALGISIWTVANHRKHICRKLGLHSTAELVAYAAQPPAGADAVECMVELRLDTGDSKLDISYRGRLSDRPVAATVRIGNKQFHF